MNKQKKNLELWMRVGDVGEYENYGQDFSALADAIHEHCIYAYEITWLNCPADPREYARKHKLNYLPPYGFTTATYSGNNYVSLFWSDETGEELIEPLSESEQEELMGYLWKLGCTHALDAEAN